MANISLVSRTMQTSATIDTTNTFDHVISITLNALALT
jgi:hypothetical protein